jgi:hypothetical protein
VQKTDDHGRDPSEEPAETDAEEKWAHSGEVVDEAQLKVRERKKKDGGNDADDGRDLRPEERRDLALRDHERESAEEDGRIDARPRTLAERRSQSAHEDQNEKRIRQ